MDKQRRNIVLIGFMGCGKSSAGTVAAELLGYEFIESDSEIESYAGSSISKIFEKHGEDYFRDVESDVCREISRRSCAVISTGGGAVKRARNIEALKQTGIVFYMEATAEHLYKNLEADTNRPLLADTHGEERLRLIKNMLGERVRLYEEAADVTVSVTGKSIRQIANEILEIHSLY